MKKEKIDKRTLRHPDFHGEKNPNAKLSKLDILLIREYYEDGMKPKKIAELFDTSGSNISNIVARRTWRKI